jgi:hypothetical protein
LQYFLVPDIEVENVDDEDEDDLEDEEEVDENVSSLKFQTSFRVFYDVGFILKILYCRPKVTDPFKGIDVT